MPYFILGLAILIGLFFLIKGIRGTNPRNLQRTTAVVVAIIATTVVIFLVVTGRLGPVGWIAALFLPLLLRLSCSKSSSVLLPRFKPSFV